jgi:retron-type reverse transcriptase
VMEYGVFKPTNIGTPQGGVITPLTQKVTLRLNGR